MNDPVQRAAQSLSGADDLESLTRPLLELMETVTGLDSTYLTTIDSAAGLQRILYSRNTRELQIPEGLEVPWGDTLCKRALDEGRAFTDNVAECWGDSDAAKALGIQTYLSQPVRTLEGDTFGTLCAASARRVSVKPETLEIVARFAALIAQQVERERALRQAQKANAELTAHALADPLTGIANRRAMEQSLLRLMKEAQRDGGTVQVAFIDLDGFKAINDKFGHETGDRFLVHVARRITATLRPGDVVARTGGDEFVVLSRSGSAFDLRERLEQAIKGRFEHGDCRIDYPGASVGVVQSQPGAGDSGDLLQRADAAMYETKKARKAARSTSSPRH